MGELLETPGSTNRFIEFLVKYIYTCMSHIQFDVLAPCHIFKTVNDGKLSIGLPTLLVLTSKCAKTHQKISILKALFEVVNMAIFAYSWISYITALASFTELHFYRFFYTSRIMDVHLEVIKSFWGVLNCLASASPRRRQAGPIAHTHSPSASVCAGKRRPPAHLPVLW